MTKQPHVQLGAKLRLPIDVVTESIAILGRKGGGKSYTASVLAEEMIAAGVPIVILDPKGDWWGLRSSVDGKSEGLPVTILGGEHGDAPLEPGAGTLIAELVVAEPSYYLLDLSAWSKSMRTRFATDFAEKLWRLKAPRIQHFPMHLFVEEADQFIPQRVYREAARMVGAFDVIIRQGRNRGLGSTIATQRAAVVNKDSLSQTEILIALQVTAPQDRKALLEWFEGKATKEELGQVASTLASLETGECWLWSPKMLDLVGRYKIRTRHTFNSGQTPRYGQQIVIPKRRADVDLSLLKERMKDVIERAEADDPKKLRARVVALEKELAAKDTPTDTPRDNPEVKILQAQVTAFEAQAQEDRRFRIFQDDAFRQASEQLETLARFIDGARAEAPSKAVERPAPVRTPAAVPTRPLPVAAQPKAAVNGSADVSKAQQRILNALGFLEAIGVAAADRTQLAFLADASPKSSGYANNLGTLRAQLGFLDYPAGGQVALTDTGRLHAHVEDVPASSEELQDLICAKLGNAKGRIIRVLIASYPGAIQRDVVANDAGASPGSSGFANNLGSLRSLGLIDYPRPGYIVATTALFLDTR